MVTEIWYILKQISKQFSLRFLPFLSLPPNPPKTTQNHPKSFQNHFKTTQNHPKPPQNQFKITQKQSKSFKPTQNHLKIPNFGLKLAQVGSTLVQVGQVGSFLETPFGQVAESTKFYIYIYIYIYISSIEQSAHGISPGGVHGCI